MTLGPVSYLWIAMGIAAIAFALWHLATGTSSDWILPALVGGVASIVAGFYQAWWEQNVFDDDPADLRHHSPPPISEGFNA